MDHLLEAPKTLIEAPKTLIEAPKTLIEACQKYRDVEQLHDELNTKLKTEKDKLFFLEAKILEFLDIIEQESVANEFGNFSKIGKVTYNLPDTKEKQDEFIKFATDQGMYSDLFKMSSISFNKVVKDIQKIKQKEEKISNFLPPGVESKEPHYILSIKKNK